MSNKDFDNIIIKNKLLKITAIILVGMITIGISSPALASKIPLIGNLFDSTDQNIYSHNYKKSIKLNYRVDNYKIKDISITPFGMILKSNLPTENDFSTQTADTAFDYELHIYDEHGEEIQISESKTGKFKSKTDIFPAPSKDSNYIKIIIKKVKYRKESNSENSPSYLAIAEEIIDERVISIK